MRLSDWGARSALNVAWEYAKCTLAAPAQQSTTVQYKSSARSMFWKLQRAWSSSLFCVYYFGQRDSANHQLGGKELNPTSCPCAVAFELEWCA